MSIRKWLTAVAAGAIAAHFYDPRSGRRRRALLHDAIGHAARVSARGLARAESDLEHRVVGAIAHARTLLRATQADDPIVVARVRSRLGRVAGSVHDVCVASTGGVVELTGEVHEDEARRVLCTVRSTRGVRGVIDELERQTSETALSPLERTPVIRRGRRRSWAPATRLSVGASAIIVAVWSLFRGGPAGAMTLAAGLAAFLRSTTDRSMGELIGVGLRRGRIDVRKTITIHAPVEEVFRVFTAFDKFSRFTRNVESAEHIANGHWRFRLHGPAGTKFDVEGMISRAVPNELVAWRSPESSAIKSTGAAHFERLGPNLTRVTIELTYRPRAGLVGHEIATLLHTDPKHEIDEEMLRAKSLLEYGRATGRNGQVTLNDVRA